MKNEYENIPQELFEFAQLDAELHDKKIETKARGYFEDALIRFKKNKSSVVAAWIILLLVLFAILSPLFSPYTMKDKDTVYQNFPPFVPSVAAKNTGHLDGAKTLSSQNELMYDKWQAIAAETGMNPVIRVLGTEEVSSIYRGKERITTYYKLEMNSYYAIGIRTQTFSFEEFEEIQQFQNETGIQVIYPWVEPKDIKDISDDPAIWYQVKDNKGTPKKDKNDNWIPAYSSNSEIEGAPYHSQRIEGDPGTWIYSVQKSGSVRCRFNYYNYYIFKNGHEPSYLFGTNNMGQDLFMAIGVGARFSLIFAVLVSAVNLTIGMIYGSIQGYSGGMIDDATHAIRPVMQLDLTNTYPMYAGTVCSDGTVKMQW